MTWAPLEKNPSEGVLRAARLFTWIENNLIIRVKEPKVIGQGKKRRKTRLVPLRFNAVQQILCQLLAYSWDREVPIRWWIPKSRQMGISTWAQAILFTLAYAQEGYHVATVAHVDFAANEIFAKSHTYEKNLAEEWRKPLKSRQQGKFEWEHESSIWVGSIKAGDALSRGPTLNAIHFSEVANYTDQGRDPAQATAAALGSLADGPDSLVLYESTAKGRDAFYFAGCERARDPRSANYDALVFLPWYLEPAYSMTWETYRQRRIAMGRKDPGASFEPDEDEKLLREKIANLVVGPGEELWKHPFELSDEQLIWYRDILATKAHGKHELRAREYPSTYEEAFSATARSMFDAETIAHYQRLSREPLCRVNLEQRTPESEVELVPSLVGRLQVWCQPVPGATYVIGADVGGEKKKADASAAYVVEESTLEVVAAYHGKPEWEVYAEDLVRLGYYYNTALLVPENNHHPAVAGYLHKSGYENLHYYTPHETKVATTLGKDAGFNTNRKTRPLMLAQLDRVCREKTLVCYDPQLSREMESFVWVEREKRYRATGKAKDDRIMALALAVLQAKNYRPKRVETPTVESPIWKRYLELAAIGEDEFDREGPLVL